MTRGAALVVLVVLAVAGVAVADPPKLVDATYKGVTLKLPEGWKVRESEADVPSLEITQEREGYTTELYVLAGLEHERFTLEGLVDRFVAGDRVREKGEIVERRSLGNSSVLVTISYGDRPKMRSVYAVRLVDQKLSYVMWLVSADDYKSLGGSKLVEEIFASLPVPAKP